MMRQFLALGLVLVVAQVSPAAALDCAKASEPIEKMLCSTAELKKADDDMSAVYFKLLRETKDPDFHALLIRSQQRWLEKRAFGPVRHGPVKDLDKTDNGELLLRWTRERLDFLRGSQPIRAMEEQRQIAAKDSSGPFAGYASYCEFWAPPQGDWGYACRSEISRQHRNRICGTWVSNEHRLASSRSVSVVENGEAKIIATCSIGGDAPTNPTGGNAATKPTGDGPATITTGIPVQPCPDPDRTDALKAIAHWNTNPDPVMAELRRRQERWKYDPDLTPAQYEQPWMNECLSAPVFPPPEQSRPDALP